jgi:hypothetical protein
VAPIRDVRSVAEQRARQICDRDDARNHIARSLAARPGAAIAYKKSDVPRRFMKQCDARNAVFLGDDWSNRSERGMVP